jgi:hypothetical protein
MGIQRSVLGLFHNSWHQNKTKEASCFWGASSIWDEWEWLLSVKRNVVKPGFTTFHHTWNISLEWDHVPFPYSKKFKTAPSAGKVMCSCLLGCEKGGGEWNVTRLQRVCHYHANTHRHMKWVWLEQILQDILLLRDNIRPHTIIKESWTVLPCPPHNSDVATLNCHFFDPAKNAIHGWKFKDGDEGTQCL